MHISLVLNEGDHVLIPNPGYPTYTSVTNLVGAVPVYDLKGKPVGTILKLRKTGFNESKNCGFIPHANRLEGARIV
jgi:hypothetical protein